MNTKLLLLAAGLAFAGTALAGDPAPQSTPSGSSLKVGFDKATGKLRPLTAEESAALDAKAAQQAGDNTSLRATHGILAAKTPLAGRRPANAREALATEQVINGFTVIQAPEDSMSEMTLQKNADGSFTILENGEAISKKTPEAGNE
ncbi:MAG: hypothetical protein KGL91_02845 [Xanthomonadaceae bacterium]|nr:hypothetical protein [Xanthomonadaceae bacterium]